MMRVLSALLCLSALLAVLAPPVRAAEGGPGVPPISRRTRSTGLPFDGRLARGVFLQETPYVRHVPEYGRDGHFWGTWEMVQLLHRAAYRVARRVPGARLSVGELSRREGGRIPGHASHQSGRDVDIAFYMTDAAGRPFDPWSFVGFDRNARATPPNQALRFDAARNWELVARLVTDPDARVQYLFVAQGIEARVLAEGRQRGASPSILDRAARVMTQPSEGHPHHNHFHMRIYCAPADRPACRDNGPIHAWYPGLPAR